MVDIYFNCGTCVLSSCCGCVDEWSYIYVFIFVSRLMCVHELQWGRKYGLWLWFCNIFPFFDMYTQFKGISSMLPLLTTLLLIAYGVYVSWLTFFLRKCTELQDFLELHILLPYKLLKQGFCQIKLRKLFSNFHDKHKDVSIKYHAICLEQINTIRSDNWWKQLFLPGVLYCLGDVKTNFCHKGVV